MPLRHRNNVDDFLFVTKCVWDKYIMPLSTTLKRFLNVTYEKAPIHPLSERFMCFYDENQELQDTFKNVVKVVDWKRCTHESIQSVKEIQKDYLVKTFNIAESKHKITQVFRKSFEKTILRENVVPINVYHCSFEYSQFFQNTICDDTDVIFVFPGFEVWIVN